MKRRHCWCGRPCFAPNTECGHHRTQLRTISAPVGLYDAIEREAMRRGTTRGAVLGAAIERALDADAEVS